jgi:hypothetical protein
VLACDSPEKKVEVYNGHRTMWFYQEGIGTYIVQFTKDGRLLELDMIYRDSSGNIIEVDTQKAKRTP